MGMYINPPNMSKEKFLMKYGVLLNSPPSWGKDFQPECYLPVCLVGQGMFTAASIVDSPERLKEFAHPDDNRPKKWFLVRKEILKLYI